MVREYDAADRVQDKYADIDAIKGFAKAIRVKKSRMVDDAAFILILNSRKQELLSEFQNPVRIRLLSGFAITSSSSHFASGASEG